jgi:hypothetical protein
VEIEIQNDIKAFIDEVIDTFVMWDLLIFCSKKSEGIHSPAQAAQLLGRTEAEVEKPVAKLLKMGLITMEKRANGETVCEIDPKSKYFPDLQKFWTYNENQENRLKILSYLLQKKVR